MAVNFNDTTPVAPATGKNVKWQFDGAGNISAYVIDVADASSYLIPAWNPGTNAGVTSDGAFVGSANQILVTQFEVLEYRTIGTISFFCTTAVGGSQSAIGVYDSTGSLVGAANNISTAATGAKRTTVTPFALEPGKTYFLAQCADNNGVQGTVLLLNTNLNTLLNGGAVTRQGSAANPMVAGVLPATLGVISAALVYPLMTLMEA